MERVTIHAPTIDGQLANDPAAPVLVVTGDGSYWADATDEIRHLLAGRPMCHALVEIEGEEMTIVGEAPDTLH